MANPSTRIIWRTVVFAGAMLATPLAGCGGSTHKQTTPPVTEDAAPVESAASEPTAAERELQAQRDAEAQEAQAQAQREADQRAAADEAKRVREAEAEQREREANERVRGSGIQPVGRGFILA